MRVPSLILGAALAIIALLTAAATLSITGDFTLSETASRAAGTHRSGPAPSVQPEASESAEGVSAIPIRIFAPENGLRVTGRYVPLTFGTGEIVGSIVASEPATEVRVEIQPPEELAGIAGLGASMVPLLEGKTAQYALAVG